MSFGFSIGDFIAVAKLATSVRKQFVDAPDQFKAISQETKSLSNVLQDIDDVLPERELTSQQKTELHNIADGCRNVLNELKETLEKYQELDSNPKTLGKKARRAWKRLKYEPEDIKELRSRIVANIALLNAFHGKLASQISLATKYGVDQLQKHQDEEERRTILDWLTPTDYGTQQSDFISRRQEGTGQWLLDSNEFQRWSSESKQTLFCPGIPGAGKTIITSIVVDYLCNTRFQNDRTVGIAYIYCNFRRQQEQKPADLLMGLLKQLVQERPSVSEYVTSLYLRHKDKRTRPPLDEISKVLHSVVTEYSRVFVAIDALDEYPVSGGSRETLVSEILNLHAKAGANLFATSRFIPDITKKFQGSMSLEIRASDADVRRYLDGHVLQLPSCVSRSLPLQEKIKTEIVKVIDGMFLLAQLHLDSLIDKTTPRKIMLALEQLPKGSEALDSAYEKAMERIHAQRPGFRDLAKRVLSWITCAKRPLTTLELRNALAVEVGGRALDEENFEETEEMVSACAGLVTIDEQTDIIRLVHYTTQEYFERTWTNWFPDAQTEIATTCVTYLTFDVFAVGFCPTDEEFEARLQLNALYDYAAQNWGHHACLASTKAVRSILDFLASDTKVSASTQALLAIAPRGYAYYSQQAPKRMTAVHLAAYFGLEGVLLSLLKNGIHHDSKDTYGQTPLSWAAKNGHEAVVKLLLERGDVEVNSKDTTYGQTPLSWAAEKGREAVVKLLLEREDVEVNSKDTEYGLTPLSWAARKEHEAVVKLLLEREDIDVNSKDTTYDQTPLSWAAENGHEAVIELLLEREDVDVNSKDTEYGQTPLSWAAREGHEAVIKLLLEREDVEVNSKDTTYGQAPLSWAASKGREAVVKLLLERQDVEADSKDTEYGQTPLSWAAKNGHEAVVKLLLERENVEVNSKDRYGRTPLSWAAENGREAVVKLLLEREDVEVNSKDTTYGQTPLSWAAEKGREAVVKLLLEREDVEVNSKDRYGRTPLSWAARRGQGAVVKLLSEKGTEISA